ncbi:hypothetical protein GUJ93_ZPchr0014g47149 [Zizania palustris]|uniref:Uncharacterized protein n=1 Tax=Zizania palustris TaxID=103762 RepID=A0A8J5T7M8_ZIZPA|nr:hypothetical protein GUJ93_ZPchr0014g47149 [Zizania palustris]
MLELYEQNHAYQVQPSHGNEADGSSARCCNHVSLTLPNLDSVGTMAATVPITDIMVFGGTTNQQRAGTSGSSNALTAVDKNIAAPSTGTPTSAEVAVSRPVAPATPVDPPPTIENGIAADVEMPPAKPEVVNSMPPEPNPVAVRVEETYQPNCVETTNLPTRAVERGMIECLEALKHFDQISLPTNVS